MTAARACLALALLAVFFAMPAAAQSVLQGAQKSVARVVIVKRGDDRIVATGSGFAVQPDILVTNAHVVDQARQQPDDYYIVVVPAVGEGYVTATLEASLEAKDLAILRLSQQVLSPAPLAPSRVGQDVKVYAIGYPGILDAIHGENLTKPRPAEAFSGEISSYTIYEAMGGAEVAIHDALISGGNSGGPLIDACGRVAGVNSAVMKERENYAIAISAKEVIALLEAHGVSATIDPRECLSIGDQIAAEIARAKRAAAGTAAPTAVTPSSAGTTPILVFAAIGVAGVIVAGLVLLLRNSSGSPASGLGRGEGAGSPGIYVAMGGVAIIAAAGLLFWLVRPTDVTQAIASPGAQPAALRYACAFEAAESTGDSADVVLGIDPVGCMNGSILLVPEGGVLRHVAADPARSGLTALAFDRDSRRLTVEQYSLSPQAYAQAAEITQSRDVNCKTDQASAAMKRQAAGKVNAELQALAADLTPTRLVWRCQGS